MAVTTVEASTATPPQCFAIHPSHGHSPAAFLDRFCGVFSPGKSPPPASGEKKYSRHGGLVHLPAGKAAPPPLLVEAADPCRGSGEKYYLGRVFRHLDEDGDGKISPSELRSCCMRTVGEELSEEDAEEVVGSTDSDGDGLLGFEDFVRLAEAEGEEERTRDLRVAFGMYAATEGRRSWQKAAGGGGGGGAAVEGCITPKSLRRMLAKLGEWKSLDECRVMIQRFDLDGDGVLSFDEFRVMML